MFSKTSIEYERAVLAYGLTTGKFLQVIGAKVKH